MEIDNKGFDQWFRQTETNRSLALRPFYRAAQLRLSLTRLTRNRNSSYLQNQISLYDFH